MQDGAAILSPEELLAIIEHLPYGTGLFDRSLRYRYYNQAGVKMSGIPLEDAIGRTPSDIMPADLAARFVPLIERAISERKTVAEVVELDFEPGKVFLAVTYVPMMDAAGEVYAVIGITEDVTRERAMQEQLLQSQRMSSLGTLSSGIAHDFNNILAIILGYLPLLERARTDGEEFNSMLQSIQRTAERATGLTKQLLAFGQGASFEAHPVDVAAVIREIAVVLSGTFPRNIQISADVPTLRVLFDENQLQQVLMNLCINARDAMPSGGRLTMCAAEVQGSDVALKFVQAEQVPYVCISVEDTGSGMTGVQKSHAFEPFFTTKGAGGSGLGLSIVYTIVQQHRGFVEIESEAGMGCRVLLYIPATKSISPHQPEPASAPSTNAGKKILLIEDEPMLRDITEQALGAAGYTVVSAEDGRCGIALLRKFADIDMVISDLGLPDMSGEDVISALLKERPGIPIIVSSGYISPKSQEQLANLGVRVLQKPVLPQNLCNAVAAMLSASQQR